MITWPLTTQATEEHSRTRGDISFLRPSASISRIRSQLGTQESQETDSYNYSDASSIGQFPAFHFSLHTLTPLSTLIDQANAARAAGRMPLQKVSHKVSILAAVLEVDGPDSIRIKKGPDAGKEVALLKIILGDESGGICKLAAWREIAEDWGGLNPAVPTPATKKGDIVLLESASPLIYLLSRRPSFSLPLSWAPHYSPHTRTPPARYGSHPGSILQVSSLHGSQIPAALPRPAYLSASAHPPN